MSELTSEPTQRPVCVLAFSGGLDTSYCVAHLTRDRGYDVIAACVDTGGFSAQELEEIEARALEVGAKEYVRIDASEALYDQVLAHLIRADALRGGVYPLSVAAERVLQAAELCRFAAERGAQAIAHGSTGAGNDQLRFDVAARVFAPQAELITPIREDNITRDRSTAYLRALGFEVQDKTTRYSINQGIWGTTIGGGETHDGWAEVPEEAYTTTIAPRLAPDEGAELTLTFEAGLPVALNGERMAPIALIQALTELGGAHGVGRGIHVGTTVLGVKGRIAFEAPGPYIIIEAHKALGKLVLTRQQEALARALSAQYSDALHNGLFFDPAMRDIEACLASMQQGVEGEVRVKLFKGSISPVGVRSERSLLGRGATYGESAKAFSGAEAAGFCKVYGMESALSYGRG
jgi:argininosuccinate synthase